MKRLKSLLFTVLMLSFIGHLSAQFRYDNVRVGISVGPTNYLGDLDDDLTFKFTQPGFGLMAAYQFHPHMSARITAFQGWASADDANNREAPRRLRNLSFRTPITEVSAQLTYDFVALKRRYPFRAKMNPYLFVGVGVFQFNPQAQLGDRWVDLQPLGTEGQYLPGEYPAPYSLTQIAIPMGGGARFALSDKWDLAVELGWRKLFTDYLDDVSGYYPDLQVLAAQNPIAAQLSDRSGPDWPANQWIRGDQTQNDWYIYSNVTISYIIDWVKCPRFR